MTDSDPPTTPLSTFRHIGATAKCDIKYIPDPARFLVDSGLLWAINRELLHPLGLALAIGIDDAGKATLAGVWDGREDPEGILYADPTDGAAKLAKYMADLGNEALASREKALGFRVQPLAATEAP